MKSEQLMLSAEDITIRSGSSPTDGWIPKIRREGHPELPDACRGR